jgi:diguanylate cyclase (GGDEF)-like protein/PAS domain S-box-containing protein
VRPSLPPTVRREDLAKAWVRSAARTSYVPRPATEIQALLNELLDELLDALCAEEFALAPAMAIGSRLVSEGFVEPDMLRGTLDVLTAGVLGDLDPVPDLVLARRVVEVLGALAAGFSVGLRTHTLDQHEAVHRALIIAVRRTEQDLRAIENRFREVFSTSAAGIAISDLNGVCVEANPALADILACQQEDLIGQDVRNLFVDDIAVYRQVLSGRSRRAHAQRRLRRADGEDAWGMVAVSLLRDGAGEPAFFVTMIQDTSELQLLQGRLEYQLLHDALTALPNRRHFETRLESILGGPTDRTVTLCCINVDAFTMVNNTYGHEVGDQLLRVVGRRLEIATSGEHALVARTGDDEFAVLIEHSPSTPDIPDLVDAINAEFAEPQYVNGHGLTVTLTIGVVRAQVTRYSPAELFRAAGSALFAARRTGRRQWATFDQHEDERARARDAAAAELAVAWEEGDLAVGYEPVVALGATPPNQVAARAVLRLADKPGGHADHLALAERTGLALLMGQELIAEVCAKQHELGMPVWLQLTRSQSGDADLMQAVNRAVEEYGVDPSTLEIALDTAAVLDDVADARDNLQVLAEIGVGTGLCEFHGGPRELGLLAEVPAHTVTLARWDVTDPLLRKETEELVGAIARRGVRCSVVDVADAAEADWWAGLGVATAQGGIFGPAR